MNFIDCYKQMKSQRVSGVSNYIISAHLTSRRQREFKILYSQVLVDTEVPLLDTHWLLTQLWPLLYF